MRIYDLPPGQCFVETLRPRDLERYRFYYAQKVRLLRINKDDEDEVVESYTLLLLSKALRNSPLLPQLRVLKW